MVKYCDWSGNTATINRIFKNAKEFLYIVSPFIKVSSKFRNSISDCLDENISVTLIYGKDELKKDERDWLSKEKRIQLAYCGDLHAKCYMNESTILITSMNLYDFSQINNYEMGIEITKEECPEIYEEIYNDVKSILKHSKQIRINSDEIIKEEEITETPKKESVPEPKKKDPELNGYCIKCNKKIELNVRVPFCIKCIEDSVKDPKKIHSFCHICGEKNKSSLEKPVCYSCYKKNKNLFE